MTLPDNFQPNDLNALHVSAVNIATYYPEEGPNEVHVILELELPFPGQLLLRIASREDLDQLVALLLEQRDLAFGG